MFRKRQSSEDAYILIKETCERIFKKRYGIFDQDVIYDAMASIILQYNKNVEQIRSLDGWIVGAIHYHYVAYVNRKEKKHQFTYDELVLENLESESYPHIKLEIEEIHAYIEKLDSPKKEIIKMRILEGLSYQEIANKLNIKTATARKNFERGIFQLKKALQLISLILGIPYGSQ